MTFEELIKKWNGGIIRSAQSNFAKKIGVTQTTVFRWVSGGSPPAEGIYPKVAKELGVTIEVLKQAFDETNSKLSEAKKETLDMSAAIPVQYVPVVGTISAETFKCVLENVVPDEILPFPLHYKGLKTFALKIEGSCMEPTAHNGDYVFVVETSYVDNGQLAVVRLDGECTLKRVYKKKDCVVLKPDNPDYKPITIKAGDLKILGKVVMFGKKP